MSLIFNAGVYYFIKDNSKNYLLSVIMYICMLFYYNSMTMMRQFLALVIVLFSYSALKKEKHKLFSSSYFSINNPFISDYCTSFISLLQNVTYKKEDHLYIFSFLNSHVKSRSNNTVHCGFSWKK